MTPHRAHPIPQPGLSIITPIATPTRASVPDVFFISNLGGSGVVARQIGPERSSS